MAKVIKNGNSYAITVNKQELKASGIDISDSLEVIIQDGQISFVKKAQSLKDEIQDFYRQGGQYNEKEIDFGGPVGNEIW
ncbi:AbrB family transcriptional regulator [Mammaliicoccus sciuri]|uniref:AbrB/MazE/SpoVT family DNA-binding domain-containing protein n=1 Tax=Mammaliicoccus sciuri TaxID=1296 RepID=UPI000CD1BC1C|nr:AbrB family transcriptional regulator [Mammaliicoccus sciuri]MDT0696765.1 AbrB family transcriptional regulator [Mammaliicoccus sciuri]MDT0704293.1 AbrB family transcriptional regulator [Mammaliicoccus sciuri]PNZ24672.1 AbrB family transcriptional regulator [Mammaliicoccus sciuri]